MAAKVIKGAPIAEEIREEIRQEIEGLKAKGHTPKLSVVLVGDDEGRIRVPAQNSRGGTRRRRFRAADDALSD